MFDLSWSEMAVIMLVALIVIGPKDLPKVARTIGQWTGKARALARDFQRSLDDMAREAELDEIKKSISGAKNLNVKKLVKDAIDPDDELERAFDVEESKPAAKAALPKPSGSLKPPVASPARSAEPASEAGEASAPIETPVAIEKPAAAAADEAPRV